MVTTYCLELTRYLTEAEYESFKSLAGPLKQKRLPQYKKYQDAQRSLCGDLLLLYMLNDKFGLKTSLASIRNGSYGKPCIQSPITIEYNLSHSGSWVVGCVSNGAPVGIDVETLSRKGSRRVMQYFSDEEKIYITARPECFDQRFYQIWTLKECYVKAAGTGLNTLLNSFSISIRETDIRVFANGNRMKHRFQQYMLGKSAICSVCSAGCTFQGPVHVDIQHLVDFLQTIR